MRQEEGKGSIKLIIAIVAIIVVGIFGFKYVKEFMNKESAKDLQADLLLIQNKVEIVKGNYSMNKVENPLKGYQLTQLPENIDIKAFLEKEVITQVEYEKYYLLDSVSLEQMSLQELIGKYPGYFIVNYDDYEVVYTEGYENENGLWCYKISDLNKKPEIQNVIPNQESVENSQDVAVPSETAQQQTTEAPSTETNQ